MENYEIFEKRESNVRSYCRTWPVMFNKAKGSIIESVDKKEYIDFFCGAGALNYGHNHDYIKEKMIKYLTDDNIIHSMDMYTKAKKEFLEFFDKNVLTPRGLDYCIQFTGPTGTNAVEAALKLARKIAAYKEAEKPENERVRRNNIIALTGAFHGMTLGALAATTDQNSRAGAGVELSNVVHIPAPYTKNTDGSFFDTISHLEWLLEYDHSGVDKPAAILIETLQAEGGVYDLGIDFLKKIREICDKHDLLMIVDDIQVGCYRTGSFFSFERAGIIPDIVTMSKSISGYGLPMAVTMFKKEFDKWKPAEHNGTFRGFQLALVASVASIELAENIKLEEQVKKKEKLIKDYLEENIDSKTKNIEIRGLGMIWGIDVKSGVLSKAIINKCFEKGLILERAGEGDSVVKLMPALNIEENLLLKGLKIICDSVNEVL